MADQREQNIQNAKEAVLGGIPIQRAARLYSVPYTTLWDRIHGAQPVTLAYEDQ